MEERVKEDKR